MTRYRDRHPTRSAARRKEAQVTLNRPRAICAGQGAAHCPRVVYVVVDAGEYRLLGPDGKQQTTVGIPVWGATGIAHARGTVADRLPSALISAAEALVRLAAIEGGREGICEAHDARVLWTGGDP